MNISNSIQYGSLRTRQDFPQAAAAPTTPDRQDEWVKNWDSNDVWWTRKTPSSGSGTGGGCG